MAPAGLYTFYRVIMTVSNEVKSSPPWSTVSFAVRSLFATLSLHLYSVLRRKEAKKREEDKEGKAP